MSAFRCSWNRESLPTAKLVEAIDAAHAAERYVHAWDTRHPDLAPANLETSARIVWVSYDDQPAEMYRVCVRVEIAYLAELL